MQAAEATGYAIAAFYRFVRLDDLPVLQQALRAVCDESNLCGILLIAPEGLNATIAGPPDTLDPALQRIAELAGVDGFEIKRSMAAGRPFKRMKVRIKQEIVTLGVAGTDPNNRVGTYVEPEDWNRLIEDPDVVVVDTRNAYEVAIGRFQRATDPGTTAFGEFPSFVQQHLAEAKPKKIALYCTGGIRCEKATSFMLDQGFTEVFHLKGGILSYLERIPQEQSLWQGGCFVFDERIAIGHGLKPLGIQLCIACDAVVDNAARASDAYEEGVSCPNCIAGLSEAKKASLRERQRQLARQGGKVQERSEG